MIILSEGDLWGQIYSPCIEASGPRNSADLQVLFP